MSPQEMRTLEVQFPGVTVSRSSDPTPDGATEAEADKRAYWRGLQIQFEDHLNSLQAATERSERRRHRRRRVALLFFLLIFIAMVLFITITMTAASRILNIPEIGWTGPLFSLLGGYALTAYYRSHY